MLIFICVVVVFADRFSVAFAADVDPFSETDIFQITGPAAGGLYIQNKAVVIYTIRAFTGHTEVCDKFASIQTEVIAGAGVIGSKIENASIGAAY